MVPTGPVSSPPQTRHQKIRCQLGNLSDLSVSASLRSHRTRSVPQVLGHSALAPPSLGHTVVAVLLRLLSACCWTSLYVLCLTFSLASSFLALLWPQRQADVCCRPVPSYSLLLHSSQWSAHDQTTVTAQDTNPSS